MTVECAYEFEDTFSNSTSSNDKNEVHHYPCILKTWLYVIVITLFDKCLSINRIENFTTS